MKRTKLAFLVSVLGLTACDHHKKAEPADAASAPLPVDSAYTGEHSYPRALPVTLPVAQPTPVSVKTVPTENVATTPTTPTPAVIEPPPPPAAASEPAPPLSAPTVAVSPPTSAPGLDTNADMPRLAMTAPSPTIAPVLPAPLSDVEARKQVVVLETKLGRIVIELDDVAAPRTCGNFRKLVTDGFYDHTIFHRVIPHFMIQGGDPNSKSEERASYGQGDPGYTLPAEIQLKHTAGTVAMARLPDGINPQRDSNGSQFFICVAACPSLDNQYTAFAHVIQGLDVVDKIANQPRDAHDDPTDRIEMKVYLETKRQALGDSSSAP